VPFIGLLFSPLILRFSEDPLSLKPLFPCPLPSFELAGCPPPFDFPSSLFLNNLFSSRSLPFFLTLGLFPSRVHRSVSFPEDLLDLLTLCPRANYSLLPSFSPQWSSQRPNLSQSSSPNIFSSRQSEAVFEFSSSD